ncbi:MAG TPA: NAD(P)-dependent alcohol dehydrogenase [Candidatus Limnocylindria bacterium]|nr:NAD(P)-dependent alcohol dehydrogenase [Candidatus Limnocylindria bacterium]
MKLRYKILTGVATTFVVAIAALAVTLAYESPCPTTPPTVADAATMRAVMQRCYGQPRVLIVERVAKPVPKEGQILVEVRAGSVNPYEWHKTTGKPYILRFFKGVGAPDSPRVGSDFAGVIAAVGPGVTRFNAGDEVFGGAHGALAEYLVMREDGDVALKPAEVSFEQAAALPIAAVTALQGLRDHGRIEAGQKVLINGAGGGVGHFCVQLAKAFGAEVTATTRPEKFDVVRASGADHLIDYTREDFTAGGRRFDLVLDMGSPASLSKLRSVLVPGGAFVQVGAAKGTGGPLVRMLSGALRARLLKQRVTFFIAKPNLADLDTLRELIEAGKVRPIIEQSYRLDQIAEAIAYAATEQAGGKITIRIADSPA